MLDLLLFEGETLRWIRKTFFHRIIRILRHIIFEKFALWRRRRPRHGRIEAADVGGEREPNCQDRDSYCCGMQLQPSTNTSCRFRGPGARFRCAKSVRRGRGSRRSAAAASGSSVGSEARNANEAGGFNDIAPPPRVRCICPGRVSAPPLETLLACKHTVKVLAHNN
jgi:hypothetical protein